MPHAEERAHHGHPDFRVGGKIFATLWPNQFRAPLKLAIADQSALIQIEPDVFSLNAWSHHGFTDVHLKRVKAARFRAVVDAAWRNVAPKRLVVKHGRMLSNK